MRMELSDKEISLTKALQDFGNVVWITDSPRHYKFIPCWFEFDGDQIFVHHLGELPPDLNYEINRIRMNNK